MKSIYILLSLFITNISFAQKTTNLDGYSEFKFGTTKSEVINKLKSEKIKFDTTAETIPKGWSNYGSYLKYEDKIKLYGEDVKINLKLYFDPRNQDKFYMADLKLTKNEANIEDAKLVADDIVKVFYEKYGYYDSIKSFMDKVFYDNGREGNGKSVHYYWGFLNGKIELSAEYFNFFNTYSNGLFAGEVSDKPADLILNVNYFDFELSKKFYDNMVKQIQKDGEEEKEILKRKF